MACKARGVIYKHVALGRDGAYGILKHLREDEGRNALAELVWHAQRRRALFLGAEDDWHQDHRQAIASRLVDAGHKVLHVLSDGSTECHPKDLEMPDFIQSEEARLRKLEKQRLSGESRHQKSSVDRSTEAVAQKLTQPPKLVDAAAELRQATNQTELCRIQRRLADLQRKSEGVDAKAGLGPKLVGVNKWVKAQADEQRENLAAGKTKDGKERKRDDEARATDSAPSYVWLGTGGTSGGNPALASSSQAAAGYPRSDSGTTTSLDATLYVECQSCGVKFPWKELEPQDGLCSSCSSTAERLFVAQEVVAAEERASTAAVADEGSVSSWRANRNRQRRAAACPSETTRLT